LMREVEKGLQLVFNALANSIRAKVDARFDTASDAGSAPATPNKKRDVKGLKLTPLKLDMRDQDEARVARRASLRANQMGESVCSTRLRSGLRAPSRGPFSSGPSPSQCNSRPSHDGMMALVSASSSQQS